MLAIQQHGNIWFVCRLDSGGNVITTLKGYKRQQQAVNHMMYLYEQGAY